MNNIVNTAPIPPAATETVKVRGQGAGVPMNGAESLLRTLVASGVEVCFANPGTSEMHFVSALDRVDGMRAVLGLFEGVEYGGQPIASDADSGIGDTNALRPVALRIGFHGHGHAPGVRELHSVANEIDEYLAELGDIRIDRIESERNQRVD